MTRTVVTSSLSITGLAVLLATGFVPTDAGVGDASGSGPGRGTGAVVVRAEFQPADRAGEALTYDESAIPVGAEVAVSAVPSAVGTWVALSVEGLEPWREYGAHVHVGRCGPDPKDSGAHFQHVPDPVTPSVDPQYANPWNEIWLDFDTNSDGDAVSSAYVPWRVGHRLAGAVVIHEHATATAPDRAGTAGDRLGCVTVPMGD